jgi:predicted NBD/HSP70 family sugar kinase
VLRQEGPTARARLAERTGLSAQTASVLMRRLEADGFVERGAPLRGKVGQPSVPMQLAPRGALFFGLKVGRRSADLSLVDFLGRIVDRQRITYRYPDPDRTLVFTRRAVAALIAGLPAAERSRIGGLGISIPGYLWEWGQQVGAAPAQTAAWRGLDIRAAVAAALDMPVFLQNDVSCACGAELIFGHGSLPKDFLYVFVGHFIGGGLVVNGSLYTGPTGNAAALGPMPVPVANGVHRQLVDVASLHGLERDLEAAGLDAALLWQDTAHWAVPDALLDAWLGRTAKGLAFALTAATAVVDVEMTVIDGWLPDAIRRALIDRTEQAMDAMNWAGLVRPALRPGTIGPDARSIGAASLPLINRYHA